ncbi:MAG: hypothetical protein EHM28_08365 [Spirochaetaceae bacterium]|nr:MAG: hypothetical protein EHM28_08365 [Spirochaetaceae bacterium]
MPEEKLMTIHGAGPDSIGLVEKITRPVAQAGGNIVDLRQDVLHGLFTITMVVDLTGSKLSTEDFAGVVDTIRKATSLELSWSVYNPVPREPGKKCLLLILLGEDAPGLGATISTTLRTYKINIEFSQMVAREHVFLMELLLDASLSTIPTANLGRTISDVMSQKKIMAILQPEDVFNKKKRLIVFSLGRSFFTQDQTEELCRQTGLDAAAIRRDYAKGNPAILSAEYLEGLPVDAIETVIRGTVVRRESQELVQTLATMGYSVGLVTPACQLFADHLAAALGLDAAIGTELPVNQDTRVISGEDVSTDAFDIDVFKSSLRMAARLGVKNEDVTVLSDADFTSPGSVGLCADIGIKTILELSNSRVLSKEHIRGIIGLFGKPAAKQGK